MHRLSWPGRPIRSPESSLAQGLCAVLGRRGFPRAGDEPRRVRRMGAGWRESSIRWQSTRALLPAPRLAPHAEVSRTSRAGRPRRSVGVRRVVARRAALTIAVLALASSVPTPVRAAEVHIDRCRSRRDSVEIVARLEVRPSPEQLWRVLTDYDSMAGFVTGIDRSKRIARSPEGPIVEQVSVARVLFMRSRVLTVLQMKERAPDTLSFRAIAGDFRRLRGTWVLERLP